MTLRNQGKLLALLAGFVLVAGGAWAQYNEAPMLQEMVASGDLPPVGERLPEDPLVVEPVDSVGQYGGTWRRAFKGIKDFHAFGRLNYEPMLRWPRDPKDPVQPGLAREWTWSDDGTELTLHLRRGLKWSDGARSRSTTSSSGGRRSRPTPTSPPPRTRNG